MGLDAVELVMAVEVEFGISISNQEAEQIRTPGMLIDLVEKKTGRPRPEIAQMIRRIVLEQTGVRESDYREDAHFIRDLHLD